MFMEDTKMTELVCRRESCGGIMIDTRIMIVAPVLKHACGRPVSNSACRYTNL